MLLIVLALSGLLLAVLGNHMDRAERRRQDEEAQARLAYVEWMRRTGQL